MPLSGVGVDLVREGKDNMATGETLRHLVSRKSKDARRQRRSICLVGSLLAQSLEGEKHIGYIHMDVIVRRSVRV